MTPDTRLLYLAPTTDAARSHVIDLVSSARAANPLIPVHLLLPTTAAIRDMRGLFGDALNVYMTDFYRLGRSVLDSAQSRVYEISDAAIRRLIYRLLREMADQGELTTFAKVWDKPGFVQSLVEWLREMKTQGIFPEQVAGHIDTERDRQLATLYARYQLFLQAHELSDTEGLLWLAAEALEADAALFKHFNPLFVLGFDQFTPIERRILRDLAVRLPDFTIHLLWDDSARDEDALALARLRETRDTLAAELQVQVRRVELSTNGSTLAHIRQRLFEPAQPARNDGSVRAIEAPSRVAEVRWALRAIKRQLLAGVRIDQIALLAPKPETYQSTVETVATEYGVPVALELPLAANAAVQALLNLLNLSPDFPWRMTFDALRSPYIQQEWLSAQQIDLLDQLTRERPVVAGRSQWRYALTPVGFGGDDTGDEDLRPPLLASTLPAEALDEIATGLNAFFDVLTPPRTGTYLDFSLWVQTALLGIGEAGEDVSGLGLAGACLDGAEQANGDVQAVEAVLSAMQSLVTASDLVPVENGDITWETYRDHLVEVLLAAHIKPDREMAALRFSSLFAARAQPVDHVYMLGLSEGELPSPPAPDVFYDAVGRETHPLPLVRPTLADSASLWWQAVSSARRSLTLLRPRIDEGGALWPPSPYWDEILAQVVGLADAVEIIRIDPQLTPEEAASVSELLIALARAERVPPGNLGGQWTNIRRALGVMDQRKGWAAAGRFEGVFETRGLVEELAQRFGPERGWSASRLNRYGACPYGFFVENVLNLEARPDPETGFDAMQRGSILHAILERLYRKLTAVGLVSSPETQAQVLAHLEDACESVFRSAPQRYGFQASALWRYEQAELHRILVALVTDACANGPDAFLPYLQEQRFGLDREGPPALILEDATGEPYKVRGVIDRIDRDERGSLRVIDYKSGAAGYSVKDVIEGRSLQTVLYALAAEQLLEANSGVEESYYLHLPNRKRSGEVRDRRGMTRAEMIAAALESAGEAVSRVRRGDFPSAPGKGSACAWCALGALCRVTRQSQWKAAQQEESE